MGPPECSFVTSSRHLRYGTLLFSDLKHRGFDGFKNLKIAAAAAKISGDCLPNLIADGMSIVIQQSFGSHQNCLRAIAALSSSQIGKRILQGMHVSTFFQ